MPQTNHRLILLFAMTGLLALFFSCASKQKLQRGSRSERIGTWVCNYNKDASVLKLRKFDLAVIDADAHPDLSLLLRSGTILIGYVSLGEVGDYRWFWPQIKGKEWILDKNPNWDSYMIDVRNPQWRALLLDEIIPRVLAQGFHGIFLDTVDTAEYLEKYHPTRKRPGSQRAMVKLIKSIRERFPSIFIVENRGFSILRETAGSIDAIVAESIFTDIDFNKKTVELKTPEQYKPDVQLLKEMRKQHRLAIFTLDYVPNQDAGLVKDIIYLSRKNRFSPYISTPQLDEIYEYTLEDRRSH